MTRSATLATALRQRSRPTRRDTFAIAAGGLTASVASPSLALPIREVDIAVVGGGAAGIAAARSLVRAGISTLIVESQRRTGGRCITDTITFGAPFDRGAHWLHSAEVNPLVRLGRDLGFSLYADPERDRLMIGQREATEAERSAYDAAVQGSEEAIVRFSESRPEDGPALAGLPRDLGEWRGPVRFRLGPYDCGKTLADISIQDYAKAAGGEDVFCRPGVGTLVATLGRGLPTSLGTPVSQVAVENDAVRIETSRGTLRARAAIVTVSTSVLAGDTIRFTPGLTDEHRAAIDGLILSSSLHVGVEIPGNPVGVEPDTTVFLKSDEERTFAAFARAGGSELWYLDTGGIYARELEAAGEQTATQLAINWLASVFGEAVRQRIARTAVTLWGRIPTIGGAWSVASPGKQTSRAALRVPLAERVFFAGEACHDTLWGTVGGAWETGEAAAREAIKLVRR
jgi:monoamine oxidase